MTLLPPNASTLERAIDAAGAARFPLPTSLAGASWNAATCPAPLLGYLAYQLSLDLWDDSWPELKKRQVCADALRLHRLKTTMAGIRAHVAIAGASIAKVVRPPSRIFATAGMTAAEREAWLETLPQLRLYPFDTRPLGSRRAFASGYAGPRFYARCYPRPSRGVELTGTRATIWDRGVERPITLEPVGADAIRLVVPRTTPRPFLGHAYWRRLYAERSAAAGNTVTLQLSGDIAGFAAAAGLDPVEIEPTRVAQGRTAPRVRAYAGHAFGRRWLQPSAAPRLVYDRVSLADPTRVAAPPRPPVRRPYPSRLPRLPRGADARRAARAVAPARGALRRARLPQGRGPRAGQPGDRGDQRLQGRARHHPRLHRHAPRRRLRAGPPVRYLSLRRDQKGRLMENQVIFRSGQDLDPADFNNMQAFAQASIDHVVGDAVTAGRGYAGFLVAITGAAKVTADPGRLYSAGAVYIRSTAIQFDFTTQQLAGGIAAIDILVDTVIPGSCALTYEIQIAGIWYPLGSVDQSVLSAGGALPPLVPLRAVFSGTPDAQPCLKITGSSCRISRSKLAFVHISAVRTLPGAGSIPASRRC